jgi:hypothetical protein
MNKTRFRETQFNWSVRCIKLFILIVCIPLLSIGANKIDDTTCLYYKLKNKKYYKGNSTVFCKNYNLNSILYYEIGRFTPSPFEIERAEEILDSCVQLKNRRKYYRKYFGYIDSDNNKCIYIEMIDCRHPYRVKRILGSNWKEHYTLILGDPYYEIAENIKINLSRSELINNNN